MTVRRSSPRAALPDVLSTSAAPYRYTISIRASGALLMRHHAAPRLPDVLGFIAGAISAFSLMALIGRGGRHGEAAPGQDDRIAPAARPALPASSCSARPASPVG